MDRLDALATELRSELGNAPVAHDAQWRRLQRDERFAPPTGRWKATLRRRDRARCGSAALVGVRARPPSRIAERVDPARGSKELDAVTAPLEHQLADTSLLLLDRQSRGRLDETDDGTRFQLETGKVRLEVSAPGRAPLPGACRRLRGHGRRHPLRRLGRHGRACDGRGRRRGPYRDAPTWWAGGAAQRRRETRG